MAGVHRRRPAPSAPAARPHGVEQRLGPVRLVSRWAEKVGHVGELHRLVELASPFDDEDETRMIMPGPLQEIRAVDAGSPSMRPDGRGALAVTQSTWTVGDVDLSGLEANPESAPRATILALPGGGYRAGYFAAGGDVDEPRSPDGSPELKPSVLSLEFSVLTFSKMLSKIEYSVLSSWDRPDRVARHCSGCAEAHDRGGWQWANDRCTIKSRS